MDKWKSVAGSVVLVALLLVIPLDAYKRNPLKDPRICGRPTCSQTNNKFRYNVGSMYIYDYYMVVNTSLAGSGDNSSELHVSATVTLDFPAPCQGVLKLSTIEVREQAPPQTTTNEQDYDDYNNGPDLSETNDVHSKSELIAEQLMNYDLRFAFHDGTISEICHEDSESAWTLNLKRGILSTLQNTMPRFDIDFQTTETDVSGICDVTYKPIGRDKKLLLFRKTKDIASCKRRYKTTSFIQTVPYDFRPNYVAWPILNSTSYCEMTVDNYIYKNVLCYERHQMVPFSNGLAGAVTETWTKLSFSQEESYAQEELKDELDIQQRSSLLYDHTPSLRESHDELKASRELLKQLCALGFPNIRRNFPDVFLNFLSAARTLSMNALHQLLFRSHSICDSGRSHILASLPYIGSPASVALMKDQIVKRAVSSEDARGWMKSLAFLKRPNTEVLESMLELIEHGKAISDEAYYYLPATMVVNTFCQIVPNCEESESVQPIVQFLETELKELTGYSAAENPTQRKLLVIVLKSLSNMGVVSKELNQELRRIIEGSELATEVRVEAVNVFRRHDCYRTRDYFLKLYSTMELEVEVRIAAYLQTMRCPDYLSVKLIKHVLKTEEVNQVGSFVWSHLKNLANSASPVRVEAQGLLAEDDLGKKFSLDIRKFSRNYEQTLFFDEYNFGLTVDSNVIIGMESYLPRTIRLNMTTDLFGESINFVELNIRAEGLEDMVQEFFGPNGTLSAKMVNEKLQQMMKALKKHIPSFLVERFWSEDQEGDDMGRDGEDGRRKRASGGRTSPTLIASALQNEVEQLGYRLKSNFSFPQLAIGVKIFGNELLYLTEDLRGQKRQMKWDILREAFSGKEVSLTKSAIFLDAAYDVPLSSGLPLGLSIVGASSVDLRMTAVARGFDILRQLADLEGKIKPSVSVDLTGTMKSDFMHAATSLKVKANLYSSSAWEAKLLARGPDSVQLLVNFPQDRNEILSVRSEILVLAEEGRELLQSGIDRRYANSTCTWPVIDQALGLKLCANYSLPDVINGGEQELPSLILSGPANFDVTLEKADPTAKAYQFKYTWVRSNGGKRAIGTVVFETPESHIPRVFRANLTLDATRNTAAMSFVNGNISHKAMGAFTNKPNQKWLEVSLNVNDRKYLALELGYNSTVARNGRHYYPSFFLSVNNERIAGLGGQVNETDKKNVTQWDYYIVFETKRLRARTKGYVSLSYNSTIMLYNKMEYQFSSSKQETLEVNAMVERARKEIVSCSGFFNLNSTAYPKFNVAINGTYLVYVGRYDLELLYNNAPDLKNQNYTTTIKTIFTQDNPDRLYLDSDENDQYDRFKHRTSLTVAVARPLSKTDMRMGLTHENMMKKGQEHKTTLDIRYAPQRDIRGVITFAMPNSREFLFETGVNLTVPGFHPLIANLKVWEKNPRAYQFEFRGIWFSAHALNVSGWYLDRSSFAKSFHQAKLDIKTSPTRREVLGFFKYVHDVQGITLNLAAEYGKRPYAIIVRHGPSLKINVTGTESYTEVRWKDAHYSISALMKSAPIKQLDLELHIDKIRDISVSLKGYSTDLKREVGIELKWDANRDPTQRVMISGELNSSTNNSYNGVVLLAYPNRSFSGTANLTILDAQCQAKARISWNTSEAIEMVFDAGAGDEMLRNVWLRFQLHTPFDGWRRNALNGGFYYKDNLLRTNISAYWAEDQNLGMELIGYYMSNEAVFNCELDTKLHSSIPHVPTARLYLKHSYEQKWFETICTYNYSVTGEPPQVLSVHTNWQYDTDGHHRNVTGSLKFESPFEDYQTGALAMMVTFSENRTVTGAAKLQIVDEKYDMVVLGHVRNIVDCMLTTIVKSPNQAFGEINGRFGLIEKERHFVAEVRTPTTTLGVELLFAVVSSQDYDIKIHFATPLKGWEKAILRAKLQQDNIDFRAGWNSVLIGCTGVWHWAHAKDFEYSYRLYTPLEKFEESALTAKLVINSERPEYVDVELSGKFTEYRLGFKAKSKPQPKLLRNLPAAGYKHVDAANDNEEDEDEDEDELNFIGDIELYTIFWPTINGTLQLTQQGNEYQATGKIDIPQGVINLDDTFTQEDLLNTMNLLVIRTPFAVAKEIKSEVVLKVPESGTDITVGMNLKFLNHSEWVKTGFHVNYKYHQDETDVQKHYMLVNLMTPIKNLQEVFLNGTFEQEDHGYKGNLTAKTMTTSASLALFFESEDQLIDTFMSVWVRAPLMPYYACRVFYKQDFTSTDNMMDLGFDVHDGTLHSDFRVNGSWSFAAPHFITGTGRYHSNFLPISKLKTEFELTRSPIPKAMVNVKLNKRNSSEECEISARAERHRKMFTIKLNVPIVGYNNLSIDGRLLHIKGSEYNVSGSIHRDDQVVQFDGNAVIIEDIPYRADVKLQSVEQIVLDGKIQYSCTQQSKVTAIALLVEMGDQMAKLDGSFKLLAMSDWFFKLAAESTVASLEEMNLYLGITPETTDKAMGKFNIRSPWVGYGIDQADVEMEFDVQPISGSVFARYGMREVAGNASCAWNWALKSNMQFALENRVVYNSIERIFRTGVRYVSPDVANNHNITFGGDLNLNNIWVFSSNASVDFFSIRDLSGVLKVQLPKPVGDVHTLAFEMRGNLPFMEPVKSFNMKTSYETDESRKRYAYVSEYSYVGHLRSLVRFEWGPDPRQQRVQTNVNLVRVGEKRELEAILQGPWYIEDTFTAYGTYDFREALHLMSCNVSIPASTKVASANVAFNNLSNMKGDVNCTTPFLNVTWIHGQLEFIETPLESIRYVKGTWPESSAVFDAKATYRQHNQDREQQGTIKIEVPLKTRHYAEVKYGLAQRPAITTGHAEVDYNSDKILNGQYTSKEESRAGFDKKTIDVTLENNFMPLGVHYVHSLSMLDADIRTLDFKRAEVFQLRNNKNFNITGEVHVVSKATGREYLVKAIHPNRTVVLTADFEQQHNVDRKQSRLELAPTVWIAFDLLLTNRSQADLESKNITLQVSYPKRNISAEGWYAYTENAFDSDILLSYSPNQTSEEDTVAVLAQRTLRGGVAWRDLANVTTSGQNLRISLGHPSFKQDVTVDALYFTNPSHLFSSKLELRYNDDDQHLFATRFNLNDLRPIVGYWNYSYDLFTVHESSDLSLDSIGSIGIRDGLYGVSSNSVYQRAYLSRMQGHVLGTLNVPHKEVLFERMTSQSKYRLWVKSAGAYPVYMINGTLIDGADIDANGFFYLDINDKLVQLRVNVTPDGSENVHMYGVIPDTRSAYFDFWRDYNESRMVDVASYLKMNHSRLITGHFLWRPQIKSDVLEWFAEYFKGLHSSFLEYTEFWIKHAYLESKDSMLGIYETAQPYVEGLLNDVSGLSVLQNDVEDLYRFLNGSYVANDFYIRSAINFTVTILDELALRNKITSLPKFLTELAQLMGDSGHALGKSLTRLFERIKQSFYNFSDIIGRIFAGDVLRYISSTLEESLQRYDDFIKQLHLQFIKNIQEIWDKCTNMATMFWHKMLFNIEPTIIRIVHYCESLSWYIGNEVFTFLYDKTQQLADSPYFNTVTNFTQDLDMLYKDLVTNDVLTNMKKYSAVTYKFVREKYFQTVPFAREFHQVMMELVDEIKELQKVEFVQFFIQRYEEAVGKLEWLAEEFQVERRLQQMWMVLRNKLTHITQTALQTENHYREAKTKFIFDPDNGIMELEQKLPMSWHAFNETPKYEEIPEIKLIGDIQDLFSGSNITLSSVYSSMCSLTDPQMWLPPFKSVGLLVGSRHFMSFDKRFLSIDLREMQQGGRLNECRYLLAHDYHNRTLTVLLEPSALKDGQSSRKVTMITEDHTLEIDIYDVSVKVDRQDRTVLPALIGTGTVVYRESDSLYVQSERGFQLTCSLRYHLCSLELSGWYFGRLAGLLGTMNNEQFDDRMMATNGYSRSDREFLDSWALPGCSSPVGTTDHKHNSLKASSELKDLCESFFLQKQSYFASCYSDVDVTPFYEMCLDLGNTLRNKSEVTPLDPGGACTAALAYIQACQLEGKLLRIPNKCISCQLLNGTFVPEGMFLNFTDEAVPAAADIVFIVEAKPCNQQFLREKSIKLLVETITQELKEHNISDTRFGVVAFGGLAPFDRPYSVAVGNADFERYDRFEPFLEHITTGNGTNEDILNAIMIASKLVYRPGASKTFILLPCSRCLMSRMRLDYSSVLQQLLENDIKLHILAHHEPSWNKGRHSRLFYGMDKQRAYTKKDVKQLIGDTELRKQLRLPKESLGECAALALETNGSVFGGHNLRPDRSANANNTNNTNNAKKFIKVFAKRIASTAIPSSCQKCECNGHNTGVAYMQCTLCSYEMPYIDIDDMLDEDIFGRIEPDYEWAYNDEVVFSNNERSSKGGGGRELI